MVRIKSNKINNINFMKQAFELAQINLGSTGVNPSVGCVVEKNGTVISSGYTSLNGRPHAEYNALKNNLNLKNSNLYVTLEPCSHYGKTPPCTNLIKKKKIKKVYFSQIDLDTRSQNKCKNVLKKKNILVKDHFLKKKGTDFYNSYNRQHKQVLPLVDAKIALSKDNYTTDKFNKRITNKYSEKITHFLRSQYNCIISSSKSINLDNSILNCRIYGLEKKSPDLVILDRNLKLKKNLTMFNLKIKRKIILFTCKKNKKKILFFKKKGIKIIIVKSLTTKNDFIFLFKKLKEMMYNRIFIEAGLNLLNFLIKERLVDNLFVFKSNKKLGKNGLNFGCSKFLKNLKFKNKIQVNLFNDTLFKEKLKNV